MTKAHEKSLHYLAKNVNLSFTADKTIQNFPRCDLSGEEIKISKYVLKCFIEQSP